MGGAVIKEKNPRPPPQGNRGPPPLVESFALARNWTLLPMKVRGIKGIEGRVALFQPHPCPGLETFDFKPFSPRCIRDCL